MRLIGNKTKLLTRISDLLEGRGIRINRLGQFAAQAFGLGEDLFHLVFGRGVFFPTDRQPGHHGHQRGGHRAGLGRR